MNNGTQRRRRVDPFTQDKREPMEILARLAGRTNFILPPGQSRQRRGVRTTKSSVSRLLELARVCGMPLPSRVGSKHQSVSGPNPRILSDIDIAQALGFARDKLGSNIAYSVACRSEAYRSRVLDGMRRRVLRELSRKPIKLIRFTAGDGNLHRVRIVVWDVFQDLVWPERRLPKRTRATSANMGYIQYCRLYREVQALMMNTGNDAAGDAIHALYKH